MIYSTQHWEYDHRNAYELVLRLKSNPNIICIIPVREMVQSDARISYAIYNGIEYCPKSDYYELLKKDEERIKEMIIYLYL